MKKILYIILTVTIISCAKEKKEFSEAELISDIKVLTNDSIILREKFINEVLPAINELELRDSVKYVMINHIAEKLKNEKDKEIFQLNYNDFRSELKLIK